jgi:hypothetical protein
LTHTLLEVLAKAATPAGLVDDIERSDATGIEVCDRYAHLDAPLDDGANRVSIAVASTPSLMQRLIFNSFG